MNMIKYLIIFALVIYHTQASAVDYYVSPNGSGSSCTEESPCAPPVAMNAAVAGETVYFRGGTYPLTGSSSDSTYTGTSTYQGRLQPANSGTLGSPITFMAYPGETPVLDVNWSTEARLGRAFGTNGHDYIIFDGFTLISEGGLRPASIIITGHDAGSDSDNCIVRNCTINGGTLGPNIDGVYWGDNVEGIRIEGSIGTRIENNLIYNFREQVSNGGNTSGTKSYDTYNTIYSNNEFYNCSQGLFLKDRGNNLVTVQNNYFHDCYVQLLYSINGGDTNDLTINNNIFANSEYMAISDIHNVLYNANNLKIFNNTFYNASTSGVPTIIATYSDAGSNTEIYNNIFYNSVSSIDISTREGILLKECDHNLYYDGISIEISRYSSPRTYTTLAAWQLSTELYGGANPGDGSMEGQPIFTDVSGTMSTPLDFALTILSPGYQDGRSGVDMGADVSIVGVGVANPVVPIVTIITESGQTTTASIFTITGTATADTGQTISGVTCSGQTVTPDDGAWDEQAESFTCLANLVLGENTLVFVGSDGTRTGSDSIVINRTSSITKITNVTLQGTIVN